jgi:adenylate cyclase
MARWRGWRETVLAVLVAGGILALVGAQRDAPVLRNLETASLDLRFRIRGPIAPGPEAAIILIDDKSLAELGRWPLSRRRLAEAVRLLTADQARVIVFDQLLSEPEQTVPAAARAAVEDAARRLDDGATKTELERIADDDPDGDFALAVRDAKRVLLPFSFNFAGTAADAPAGFDDNAYQQFDKSLIAPVFPLNPVAVAPPLAPFAAAAAGMAHVNIAFDRDGAPRYDYPVLPFAADFYPSMPVRAVAQFLGVPWNQVALAPGEGVRIGTLVVPTDRAMRLLVNYRGPRATFPTYSFVDLVDGRVPVEALRDRIVLVGAAAVGINDTFQSPFGITPLPGVERMADIIDTIMARDFIQRPDLLRWAELAIVLLLAALAGAATTILPTRVSALACLAPLILWALAAQALFGRGLWLAVAAPESAFAATLVALLAFRYWIADRDGRMVKSAFRHYLAPELVNALAAHPERLRLGGETRPMTVLFCDIRGFTTLSEGMAPEALVQMVNRFLTPSAEAVMRHQGTVDKYIGDCLMAFWNAPLDDADHARHACEAADDILAQVERLDQEFTRTGWPHLAVGIGLNSGPCLVGNLGSAQRFQYSVLGDTVNVAARLEAMTKVYGVPILAGDATRALAPGLPWLAVDDVAVRGRAAAVRVHTLWQGTPEQHARLAPLHEALLAARHDGRDDEAAALLAEATQVAEPRLDKLYRALSKNREAAD